MFEAKLKQTHPTLRNITYDVSDLFKYIDELADLSALVYATSSCLSLENCIHCCALVCVT